MVFDKDINRMQAHIPSNKAIFRICLLTYFKLEFGSFASFSEIIFVVAKFTPEQETVIASAYTDISKLKAPIASVPILFDT